MKAKTYGKKQGGKANTSDAGVVGPSGEAPPLSRTGGGAKTEGATMARVQTSAPDRRMSSG